METWNALKSKTILITDVLDFVNHANQVKNGDVLLKRGKFVVDGKSYLGVLSICDDCPLVVEYPSDKNFEDYIENYSVRVNGLKRVD